MTNTTFTDAKIIKKATMLKENNLYPWFRAIENSEGSRVSVQGKNQIMIGSNNYLGFTHHPEVQEAAIKAIEKFGTGCTGSRFLNGNLSLHEELEEKLAEYTGFESAVLFSTGMQSNLGALSALCGHKRDCMIYDSENHASLIDASRLAMGPTFKFKHNNLESLEEQLQSSVNRFKRVIVVADGVFSMTGSICPVPQVRELCQKYGAELYIDDAHGIGVMGAKGRGHFTTSTKRNVDYVMGTFSKSFASIGGFVVGSKEAMDYVRRQDRILAHQCHQCRSDSSKVS